MSARFARYAICITAAVFGIAFIHGVVFENEVNAYIAQTLSPGWTSYVLISPLVLFFISWAIGGFLIFPKTMIYPKNSAAVDLSTGKIMHLFKKEACAWKRHFPDIMVVSLDDIERIIMMNVSPITENPKVRKIKYTVSLRLALSSVDTLKSFITFITVKKGLKLQILNEYSNIRAFIDEVVKYELYEFNNAYSKKIADYYNPLNSEQQQGFMRLISKFLNGKLQPIGLTVDRASFALDE